MNDNGDGDDRGDGGRGGVGDTPRPRPHAPHAHAPGHGDARHIPVGDNVVRHPTAFRDPRAVLEEVLAHADNLTRVVLICEWDGERVGFGHSAMSDIELWWMLTQTVARLQRLLDAKYPDLPGAPPPAA